MSYMRSAFKGKAMLMAPLSRRIIFEFWDMLYVVRNDIYHDTIRAFQIRCSGFFKKDTGTYVAPDAVLLPNTNMIINLIRSSFNR